MDIGPGGCLRLGFGGLAHDFELLDITGANTWFACSLMNPMVSSQALDPENQAHNCVTHKGKSAKRTIKILGNTGRLHYPVNPTMAQSVMEQHFYHLGGKEASTIFGCETKALLISLSSGWVGQGKHQEAKNREGTK